MRDRLEVILHDVKSRSLRNVPDELAFEFPTSSRCPGLVWWKWVPPTELASPTTKRLSRKRCSESGGS